MIELTHTKKCKIEKEKESQRGLKLSPPRFLYCGVCLISLKKKLTGGIFDKENCDKN